MTEKKGRAWREGRNKKKKSFFMGGGAVKRGGPVRGGAERKEINQQGRYKLKLEQAEHELEHGRKGKVKSENKRTMRKGIQIDGTNVE